MAVAQSVEGQSGPYRGHATSSITVHGGPEHAAVEGAASDRAAGAGSEHTRAVSRGKVFL